MVNWPHSLVAEVAERRAIIFVGAGVSAGCRNSNGASPPRWADFLRAAVLRMQTQKSRREAMKFIKRNQLLDAAEVIFNDITPPEKRLFFQEQFTNPNFLHSRVHELILELDPKIVVTTNYDEIYDNYCRSGRAGAAGAYSICRQHDENTLDLIRSPDRLVLKAHGCVTSTNHAVITRKEYFENRRAYASFYKILDALFLTNTILFLGYSLSDPDIQLVLENANISAPCSHPHYAVIEKSLNPAIDLAIKRACNLELLQYPRGKHESVEAALEILGDRVTEYRARRAAGIATPGSTSAGVPTP